MDVKFNKKGIFFTATVILLLALFMVSFTLFEDVQNRKSVQKRVATMNNFISSTEKDISRKVYVISYRTIFLMEKEIRNGSYIEDFDSVFQEAFFDSKFRGELQPILWDITKGGANYTTIKDQVESSGRDINILISLSNPRLIINQTDPWNVKVTLIVDIYMKDKSNLASWNRTSYIDAYIPITNFDDPVYYIETSGLYVNRITKTPFARFAGNSPLDLSNLTSQVTNLYYRASPSAPNFISRMKGLIGNQDMTGIESLVNVHNVSLKGGPTYNKSVVDYIYFNATLNPTHYGVSQMQNWFRIDQEHLDDYNLNLAMTY